MNDTEIPRWLSRNSVSCISLIKSRLLRDVNDCNDNTAQLESEKILWTHSAHCSAVKMANDSTVCSDRWSDVLRLTSYWMDGMVTAKPVLFLLGSLDPSVYGMLGVNDWYVFCAKSVNFSGKWAPPCWLASLKCVGSKEKHGCTDGTAIAWLAPEGKINEKERKKGRRGGNRYTGALPKPDTYHVWSKGCRVVL